MSVPKDAERSADRAIWAALDAALDVWEDVDMQDVRLRSLELSDQFISQVETRCPDLKLETPREHIQRGSQVSFSHPEGYAIMQALIARGVIGDFRAPNILRFGFTPLYIGREDVDAAVAILEEILVNRQWYRAEFKMRAKVT